MGDQAGNSVKPVGSVVSLPNSSMKMVDGTPPTSSIDCCGSIQVVVVPLPGVVLARPQVPSPETFMKDELPVVPVEKISA